MLVIDRVTATRLGITPQAIDDALYDAFGQRQISTLFTQLNQYHVILEAQPEFQRNPSKLHDIYVSSATGTAVPLSAFTHFESGTAPLAMNPPGSISGGDHFLRPRARRSPGRSHQSHRTGEKKLKCRRACKRLSKVPQQAFMRRSPNEPLLILAAIVTVYIVLGVLYESYIHPITILSTLPSAGMGAILALLISRRNSVWWRSSASFCSSAS